MGMRGASPGKIIFIKDAFPEMIEMVEMVGRDESQLIVIDNYPPILESAVAIDIFSSAER